MGRGDVWLSGSVGRVPSQAAVRQSLRFASGMFFLTIKQLSTRREDALWLRYRFTPGMGWFLHCIL